MRLWDRRDLIVTYSKSFWAVFAVFALRGLGLLVHSRRSVSIRSRRMRLIVVW